MHFEWWGEIPFTAKGGDCQHLKSVCFNNTKNVTFEKEYVSIKLKNVTFEKSMENIRAFV